MKNNPKLKLFISYSHLDEKDIEEFRKHIAPLKRNGNIDDWYDRKIVSGQIFHDEIENNLENADIICLFISANFLSSSSCMKEKMNALKLMKKKGIAIVPIILSACGWQDDKKISNLLVLPTDGKPISDFGDSNKAWNIVYEGLKLVIEKEIIIKQLKITKQFSAFLQNTGLLTKAHSHKEEVLLDDIFVHPELEKYDDFKEYEKKVSSEKLLATFYDYPKILIAGENQSGKTTLCKKIFIDLRKKNFVPVYISDKTIYYKGRIENKITKAFKEQYESVSATVIDKHRIVPILDDFHYAKNKEKHLQDLSTYHHQIIVVDDVFCLNFKDENLISLFSHFRINEYVPSLRDQLIKKWTHLTDLKNDNNQNENEVYKNIDKTTELVNSALGKIIGSGIMPAYPFFILSVISTYETFEKPLAQEITSQGYCYQALIYLYLRKQGVKNDDIDTYINFLTEFAYYFYTSKKNEISIDEFNSFIDSYSSKFNLPIKQETLLYNLQQTQIIKLDNLNNYCFCYHYLFYFFVAKYLAENSEENKEIIASIINNLHKDENAYIAIFISHHSYNDNILDEIMLNALCLFDKYEPATLSKEELGFFDEQVNSIVKEVLLPINVTPEKERAKRLESQDVLEQTKFGDKKNNDHDEDNYDDLALELRRSVKTVEVMGRIIKNRAGSLEKSRLEEIFKEGMEVHLRILTSFFELIKHEEDQREIVDVISERLNTIIELEAAERKKEGKKERRPSNIELETLSRKIFWRMCFTVVYGFIGKVIHSLGSNKLTAIVNEVCDKENTPASVLVKNGILMWFSKNLQIDNIAKRIDEDDFSETAIQVMKFKIVNHCSMHSLSFKEKQRVENKFGIPSKELVIQQVKRIENE